MAETAVGLVIDKLFSLLNEETKLLSGIKEEVKAITSELRSIMALLKDADTRADVKGNNFSHSVKVWVDDLRGVAFQIEDVIDDYMYFIAQQHHRLHRCGFIQFVRKIACLIVHLKSRHNIASKVQELKETVRGINERRETYRFDSTGQESTNDVSQNSSWCDPRKDSCYLNKKQVVGIESAKEDLVARLEDKAPHRGVISLVGMGGLGKTTLAHQVYVHVKGGFDCHAWIEVSKTYNKEELLRNLIKVLCSEREEPVPAGIDTMDESTVMRKLRDYLKGKSYLLVFDDVWKSSFWDDVKNSLPSDSDEIGRIMITTRDVNVANFCKPRVHIHQLQPLPPNFAWEFFCDRAFQGRCPANLEEVSRDILKRCEGLPLAICVIADVVSTKAMNAPECAKFLTRLSSELETDQRSSIEKVFSASYNDLPHNLKSCFLYFGIFPEDHHIRCKRLIRLWIAEDFVKQETNKALEEVAEEYLAELINRSLVQVSEIGFDGKPRSCRIHDLLREILVKKMKDLHFCQVLSRSNPKFEGLARRVSILHSSNGAFEGFAETYYVRSLLNFAKDKMHNFLGSTIPRHFKRLKVLDFEDAPTLNHLPKDIGKLFHLKYLSVKGTRVQVLPKSIGKLENLETLDLQQSLVHELPVEINSLQKLRHLLAYHIDDKLDVHINKQRGVKVEKGIGMLKALQQLYVVEANVAKVDVIEELSHLTNLRTLGIKKLRSEDGKTLCDSIQKMEYLETLEVSSTGESENETLDLECMSGPPRFLQYLSLSGHLRKLPEWIANLQNLVQLKFFWSKLEDDPLKALQNLPNLLELGIFKDAYCGEKLCFEEGAFPNVKVLHLRHLSGLNSVVIEEGALCNLEEFYIGPCPQMKELPSGFQLLRNLKRVGFYEMTVHFLMLQNLQCLENGPQVRFIFTLSREPSFMPLKDVFDLQKYMQEHDEEDWKSFSVEQVWRMYVDWKPFPLERFRRNYPDDDKAYEPICKAAPICEAASICKAALQDDTDSMKEENLELLLDSCAVLEKETKALGT